MAGVKKVVKRRRRRRGKKRMYFGTDTHDSIVKYQGEECGKEREAIYVKEILPSFEKLVENLIFIHGFVKPNAPYEEIKNDCVTFLYETLYLSIQNYLYIFQSILQPIEVLIFYYPYDCY